MKRRSMVSWTSFMARLFGLVSVIFVVVGIFDIAGLSSASADQRDGRLAGLFARLNAPGASTTAPLIERKIWAIWIDIDDPKAATLMTEGIEHLDRGRQDAALASFDELIRLKPDVAEAWNKRATVLYLLGRFDESVEDIQKTLALEPRHFGALSGLGLIYEAIDEPAAALRSLEAAIEIHPYMGGVNERIESLRRQLAGQPT